MHKYDDKVEEYACRQVLFMQHYDDLYQKYQVAIRQNTQMKQKIQYFNKKYGEPSDVGSSFVDS